MNGNYFGKLLIMLSYLLVFTHILFATETALVLKNESPSIELPSIVFGPPNYLSYLDDARSFLTHPLLPAHVSQTQINTFNLARNNSSKLAS